MTRDEVVQFLATRRQHWKDRDPVALASDHSDEGTVQSPDLRVDSWPRRD